MRVWFLGALLFATLAAGQAPTPSPTPLFPSGVTLSFNAGPAIPVINPATPGCQSDFVNLGAGSTQGSFQIVYVPCWCRATGATIAPGGTSATITGTCSVDTIVPPQPTPTPTPTPTATPTPTPSAAHIQSCPVAHSTSGSATIACSNVGADLLVVGVDVNDTGCSLTVSQGTMAFTRAPHGPALQPGTGAAYIFSASFTSAPGNISVAVSTANCSGAVLDAWADEFQGVSTLDIDAAGVSSTGTAINTPSVTPVVANEAVYNTCIVGGNISSTSPPWTLDALSNGNAASWAVVSSTAALPVAYVESGGSGWACAEAAFR